MDCRTGNGGDGRGNGGSSVEDGWGAVAVYSNFLFATLARTGRKRGRRRITWEYLLAACATTEEEFMLQYRRYVDPTTRRVRYCTSRRVLLYCCTKVLAVPPPSSSPSPSPSLWLLLSHAADENSDSALRHYGQPSLLPRARSRRVSFVCSRGEAEAVVASAATAERRLARLSWISIARRYYRRTALVQLSLTSRVDEREMSTAAGKGMQAQSLSKRASSN